MRRRRYEEEYPPEHEEERAERPRRRERERHSRPGILKSILALIGALTLLYLFVTFVLIPFLAYLTPK